MVARVCSPLTDDGVLHRPVKLNTMEGTVRSVAKERGFSMGLQSTSVRVGEAFSCHKSRLVPALPNTSHGIRHARIRHIHYGFNLIHAVRSPVFAAAHASLRSGLCGQPEALIIGLGATARRHCREHQMSCFKIIKPPSSGVCTHERTR